VPVSDLAEAADVSRQVLYQQFGDRDGLLLAAALDLIRRDLLEQLRDHTGTMSAQLATLAMARHFADHRRFYRALLTSSCAFALDEALTGVFHPLNRRFVEHAFGRLAPRTVDDLAAFLTGGAAAVVNTWVVHGPEPLDPHELTDRLTRIHDVISGSIRNEDR
jgi:AcrR family transcriptional regulator